MNYVAFVAANLFANNSFMEYELKNSRKAEKKNFATNQAEALREPKQSTSRKYQPSNMDDPAPKHIVKSQKKKVVKHSYTMPKSDYNMIATLRKKLKKLGIKVGKNAILRAGINELSKLSRSDFKKKLSKLYLNI